MTAQEAVLNREAIEALHPVHAPPTTFFSKYLWSLDHKVIAKQYLWSGLIFLLIGGTLAMMIRWQWAFPGQPMPIIGPTILRSSGGVIGPALYMQVFTMHGLIMIFFAITPVLIGAFGNLLIPLLIGARDMAFPWLNALSFWVLALSQVLVIAAFFGDLGAAGAGWTTYPPLSTNVGTPGMGQTLMVAAVFVTGVGSIMGGINYVTTVIRLRAPGMTYMRMPLTLWGLFLTAILNVLFVPVLGSAALLLLMDRLFGTQFFIAGVAAVKGGGDPILFQHLFWIFGHPGGLHPHPSGVGHRRRPPRLFRSPTGQLVQGNGRCDVRGDHPQRSGLRPPHVQHRDESATGAELHDDDAAH